MSASGRGHSWLGVDVGGPRKGFDVALIRDGELVSLAGRLRVADVVAVARDASPLVVAIDGPRRCAPDGRRARDEERLLARSVCGIRWTPDAAAIGSNPYYAWIAEGLGLYAALRPEPIELIEVFPTASWTRWCGTRGSQARSRWTRTGLARLGINGIPDRTNQDQRDAIAAAVTAWQHSRGRTEAFGEIVVPLAAGVDTVGATG